ARGGGESAGGGPARPARARAGFPAEARSRDPELDHTGIQITTRGGARSARCRDRDSRGGRPTAAPMEPRGGGRSLVAWAALQAGRGPGGLLGRKDRTLLDGHQLRAWLGHGEAARGGANDRRAEPPRIGGGLALGGGDRFHPRSIAMPELR